VLTEARWQLAQQLREPFDEHAPLCEHPAEQPKAAPPPNAATPAEVPA
jgi:hypothetical protein